MSPLQELRKRLGLTQSEAGEIMGCTQPNVGHYERGQTIPPQAARRLIAHARAKGHEVSYEDVYGPLDAPAEDVAAIPFPDRRDPARVSPYAGTDIDRRAPAGTGRA